MVRMKSTRKVAAVSGGCWVLLRLSGVVVGGAALSSALQGETVMKHPLKTRKLWGITGW